MGSISTDNTIDTDVIIVGGGSCGLALSCFLSAQNVDHILFEKRAGTGHLPKANYLNQRTMEMLKQYGIADQIIEKAGSTRYIKSAAWLSSLAGDGPHDRKLLARISVFGGEEGSSLEADRKRYSAMEPSNMPQVRLEPLLRKIAEKRNPDRVLFSHEVTDLEQNDDHVTVIVKSAEGQTKTHRAKYVVGADGGKSIGPKIGVTMTGPTNLADLVSTHFKADLSKYWDDQNFFVTFINPEGGRVLESGILIPIGPSPGRFCEEWTFHFAFDLKDESRWNEELLVPRIRQMLKLPDLELEVLHINHWVAERVLADKYQEGRVFVAGDAAHRQPPSGGLGLNTAIGDAHNIAWKLAIVLQGKADSELLKTYEMERRPIGKRNADWGLTGWSNMAVLINAFGLLPGQREHNEARFAAILEDSDTGATARQLIQETIAMQKIEYSIPDLELGYVFENGAIVPDGTARPRPDPLGQTYTPTTRPGHRLPHAWIRKVDQRDMEKVISTHDLIGAGPHFLVITDADGSEWVQAAAEVGQRLKVEIRAVTIDTLPLYGKKMQYVDHNGAWEKVKGFERGGAILVRPDGMVAGRSPGRSAIDDSIAELGKAMSTILAGGPQLQRPVAGKSWFNQAHGVSVERMVYT